MTLAAVPDSMHEWVAELGPRKGQTFYSVHLRCEGIPTCQMHKPKDADHRPEEERIAWMIENCPSRTRDDIDYTTVFWRATFTEFADALAFYLRWGQSL